MNILNFALQPGSVDLLKPTSKRRISYEQLMLPNVHGVTIRMLPDWPLEFLDACVATARKANKLYTILVKSGESRFGVDLYLKLNAQIFIRYRKDRLWWGQHLSGCTPSGVSEELHFAKITEQIYQTNCRIIDSLSPSLPRLLVAGAGGDIKGCTRILDYAGERFGKSRVVAKHNSMKAGTSPTAPHNLFVRDAGRRGYSVGFEDACSAVDNAGRYGGSVKDGVKMAAKLALASQTQYDVYRGIYPPDLKYL